MDATQRLCEPSDDENETTFNLEEFEKKVFGKFVFVKQGGDDNADPEISFDVFGGENRIGRDSEQSRIVLDNKSLSRVHAVIEVSRDGSVAIYDDYSMNGTYKKSQKLKSGVRYALEGGEDLTLGDLKAKFITVHKAPSTPDKQSTGGAYFVPETPSTLIKGSHGRLFDPNVSSTPFPNNDRHIIEDSNVDDSDKTADDSSFIAPSQQVVPRIPFTSGTPAESHGNQTSAVDESPSTKIGESTVDLMNEETQKFDDSLASKIGESQRTFGESTMNLMDMETQRFEDTDLTDSKDREKLMAMETQHFGGEDSSASKIGESHRTFGESTMNLMNMETQRFEDNSDLTDSKDREKLMAMETQRFRGEDSSVSNLGESHRTFGESTMNLMNMETQRFEDSSDLIDSQERERLMAMETQCFDADVATTEATVLSNGTDGAAVTARSEAGNIIEAEKRKNGEKVEDIFDAETQIMDDEEGNVSNPPEPPKEDVEMQEVEEDLIVPVKHFKCGEKNNTTKSLPNEQEDDDYEENLDLDAPFIEDTPKQQGEETEAHEKEEADAVAEAPTTSDQTSNDVPRSKTDSETQLLDGTVASDLEEVNPDDDETKAENHPEQQPDEDDEVQSNASEDLLADVSPDTLEADDSEVADDNNDSSKIVEPEKQSTTVEEEYEEEYEGATQLFDSEDKNEDGILDHQANDDMGAGKVSETSSDDDDEDFIASSQASVPDRTNFSYKAMTLTTIADTSIEQHDENVAGVSSDADAVDDSVVIEETIVAEESMEIDEKTANADAAEPREPAEAAEATVKEDERESMLVTKVIRRSKPFSQAHLAQLEVEPVSSPVLSTGPLESEEQNEEEDEVDSETLLGSTQVMMGIPEDEPAVEASSSSPILPDSALKSEDEKIEPKPETEVPEAASPLKRGRGRRGAAKIDVVSPIPEVKFEDSGVRRSGRATKPSTKISSEDFVSDPFIHDQPITPSRRSRKSLPEVEDKVKVEGAQPLAKDEKPDQQGIEENGTPVKSKGKEEKNQKKGRRSKVQAVQNDSELASGSRNETASKEEASAGENMADVIAKSSVERPSEGNTDIETRETAAAHADTNLQVSSPSKTTGRKGKRGSKLEAPVAEKVVETAVNDGCTTKRSVEVKATTGSRGGGHKRGSKVETELDKEQTVASPKHGKGKKSMLADPSSGPSQRSKRFRLSEKADDSALPEHQTEGAEETAGQENKRNRRPPGKRSSAEEVPEPVQNDVPAAVASGGRRGRGRQPATPKDLESSVVEIDHEPVAPVSRKERKSSKPNDAHDSSVIETDEEPVAAVGRRGRQAAKPKQAQELAVIETDEEPVAAVGRRGRQAAKPKDARHSVVEEPVTAVGRRGRQSGKVKDANDSSVIVTDEEPVPTGSRRGRQPAKAKEDQDSSVNVESSGKKEKPEVATSQAPSLAKETAAASKNGRRQTKASAAEPLDSAHSEVEKEDKDVPPKAAGRGRASKRGQELAEPVVEKNASSPSKRKGRSSEAEVPPKKINSADDASLPGPSSGAATATTEVAAIDDEDEMLAVKTTSSPVTYSRKRKAEQSLMSPIDEDDEMFSHKKSVSPKTARMTMCPLAKPHVPKKTEVKRGRGRDSAVSKAEEESELDQSTSSVVSTASTRGRRKGSAAQALAPPTSGTASAASRGGAVPKTVTAEVESELNQSASSVASTASTRGRRKGSAAQKLDGVAAGAIPKTEPTAATSSGRRSRGVKVEEPDKKKDEDEVFETAKTTKRQNGKAANKKIEEIKRDVERLSTSSTDSMSGKSPTRREKQKPIIMFTGYEDKQDEKIVKDLGGKLTTNPGDCTVLVTDQIRRTAKFLCTMGKGIPIVSRLWLVNSKDAKTFLDPWKHILVDDESEKKWGFKLNASLTQAAKEPLLRGYKVGATKKCLPPPDQLKEMVECAGGTWLKSLPRKAEENQFVLSCPEDKAESEKLAKSGIKVVDKEMLLSGLLKQTLDFKAYALKN